MKRVKQFVAAAAVATLFFGCKAKEQRAEALPPEKPKAQAPAEAKPESPSPPHGQPEGKPSAPAEAPRQGHHRARLRAALLKHKAPDTLQGRRATTRGDFI